MDNGFRSKREQKRFAKLLTYAVIYHQGGEWDEKVEGSCCIARERLGVF